MIRYIDSIIKFYEIIYRDIHKKIDNFNRIKYYNNSNNDSNNNSNSNYLHNIISAFDSEYNFNNYCCFCLNPKLNDVFIKLNCEHEMHYYCFNNFIKSNNVCPFCKSELNSNEKNKVNFKEEDISITFDYDNKTNYKIYELYYN
jgi:hypothetical protein